MLHGGILANLGETLNIAHIMCLFRLKMYQSRLTAGLYPDPLQEVTALHSPYLGLGDHFTAEKEGRER